MNKQNIKNTLQNNQSTKPLTATISPKYKTFKNFGKTNIMPKNGPSFLQRFRTQSRGGK